MKNICLVAFLSLSITAFCQTNQPMDSLELMRADKRAAILSRMTEDLGLNENQQMQVADVLLVRSNAITLLPASGQTRESELVAINAQAVNQLAGTLTQEQLALYHQLRQELQARREQYGVQDTDDELNF